MLLLAHIINTVVSRHIITTSTHNRIAAISITPATMLIIYIYISTSGGE